MRDKLPESDWKTFRKRVPEWRERYLNRKNQEIIAVLNDEKRTPTEKFWDAFEAMRKEARILENCLDGHSRSKMGLYLALMYQHGLIDADDLNEFSNQLLTQIVNKPET